MGRLDTGERGTGAQDTQLGTELAAANARALVSDWMTTHGRRIGGIGWEPAITARRIIAWLQHSAVVLQGAELSFYRAYLRSLPVPRTRREGRALEWSPSSRPF